MLVAQAIPPSAFQNRNTGQRMPLMPASQAEAIRRPDTQRPRNTAFGPCLAKNGSPTPRTPGGRAWSGGERANGRGRAAGDEEPPAAVAAADGEADVVADDGRGAGHDDQRGDVHLPVVGEQ